jgi:hypothetical protein
MIFKTVYRYLPVFVFYANFLSRNDSIGRCWGMLCIIRPQYRSDNALLAHELCHCEQWYRTLGIHGIWYHLSDSYKLKCEVEAYKVQLAWYEKEDTPELHQQRLRIYARMITDCYNLKVSFLDAIDLLS